MFASISFGMGGGTLYFAYFNRHPGGIVTLQAKAEAEAKVRQQKIDNGELSIVSAKVNELGWKVTTFTNNAPKNPTEQEENHLCYTGRTANRSC